MRKSMTAQPITAIIQTRYSCRNYLPVSIPPESQAQLRDFLANLAPGPFGTRQRFELVAATDGDRTALRKLGTYGYIKNPPGFIIGATKAGAFDLEDYGYQMEKIILEATRLGLGTCWLGGTFTKSSFPKKIAARNDELVPAVTAVGIPAATRRLIETIRRPDPTVERRLPFENLFYDGGFDCPLSQQDAGDYGSPLEMVRRGPSASNKQPWRVVSDGDCWHFYMQRTPGYRESWLVRWATVADMQRLDMGIAMLHFELTAREQGLPGRWLRDEPAIEKPDGLTEYVVSWG
jgi:nitroreductase